MEAHVLTGRTQAFWLGGLRRARVTAAPIVEGLSVSVVFRLWRRSFRFVVCRQISGASYGLDLKISRSSSPLVGLVPRQYLIGTETDRTRGKTPAHGARSQVRARVIVRTIAVHGGRLRTNRKEEGKRSMEVPAPSNVQNTSDTRREEGLEVPNHVSNELSSREVPRTVHLVF